MMSSYSAPPTIQNFFVGNPTPIFQALLWQYDAASSLSALVNQKTDWYRTWDDNFWNSWITNVFNLVTANSFGLSVWSVILQVPSFLNSAVVDNSNIFGFNAYVPPNTPPVLLNTYKNFNTDSPGIGANFAGAGDSTILTVEQQRWLLRLRYLYLVSRGSCSQSNYNFNWLMKSSIALGLFDPDTPVANPVVLTGTTVTSSANITGLSTTEGLTVGLGINGAGIPDNSTISAITSSTSITMTTLATASGTVSLSFGLPAMWVIDNFNMSITYQFNFYLPSVLQSAINLVNVLPNPAGVEVIKQYWNGAAYANF